VKQKYAVKFTPKETKESESKLDNTSAPLPTAKLIVQRQKSSFYKANRPVLISVSSALSQTPVYTARPRTWG